MAIAGAVLVGGAVAGAAYATHLIPQREVFAVAKGSYGSVDGMTADEAKAAALKFKAKVATSAQLRAAMLAGASWCKYGWVAEADGSLAHKMMPIQNHLVNPYNGAAITEGCGTADKVVNTWDDSKTAGVVLYGIKPKKKDAVAGFEVLAWNGAKGEKLGWYASGIRLF